MWIYTNINVPWASYPGFVFRLQGRNHAHMDSSSPWLRTWASGTAFLRNLRWPDGHIRWKAEGVADRLLVYWRSNCRPERSSTLLTKRKSSHNHEQCCKEYKNSVKIDSANQNVTSYSTQRRKTKLAIHWLLMIME